MPIREVLVVEGKHDSALLKSVTDCETIITNGSTLSQTTQKLIVETARQRGIIVFTDPDSTGERIRRQITKLVPEAKHAFLPQHLALGKGKIGVEHAKASDILAALENIKTFEEPTQTITMADLFDLGLSGGQESEMRRNRIGHHYNIGDCNAKTFLKRCGMLRITPQQLKDTVEVLWKNR
ncbi:MAG: ribonuclease M5 [Erysipelotrichaceae bacterium]